MEQSGHSRKLACVVSGHLASESARLKILIDLIGSTLYPMENLIVPLVDYALSRGVRALALH